jgi:hypothetical protein
MPHFGANEDLKMVVDEYYKLMNCNRFTKGKIEWDVFCTGTCTDGPERLRAMFGGEYYS